MIEQWKDIAGYEGQYQVSDHGRIKSLKRTYQSGNGGIRRVKEFIKAPQYDIRGGAMVVGLCKNGKTTQRQIAQLVLEAFVGAREGRARVVYADLNRENVALPNLSWGPENRCTPRLTQPQAEEVRQALQAGVTTRELAKKYAIAQSTIVAIGQGDRYKPKSRSEHGIDHQPGTAQYQDCTS